jgi:hypothetical protein
MLFIVNCSTNLINPTPTNDVDPSLLEISKAPESEAVFATMAIQMETKGGFHRVLSLLNELVTDSKEQLHSMLKIWRGVSARCQVSKLKLHEREEFFETYLHQAQRHVNEAKHRVAELGDTLKGYLKSEDVYGAILKSEIARHSFAKKHLKGRFAHAQHGLNSLKEAQKAVNDWTPKGRALIQTHLSEVAVSYLKVKNMELPNITEFLERTNDKKVRKRLLEWLKSVQHHLLIGAGVFRNALTKLQRLGDVVEVDLAKMIVAIRAAVVHIRKAITFSHHIVSNGQKGVALFQNLINQNKKIIASHRAYCHNEKVNFHKNELLARSSIKLFREVRHYFITHYKKIHSYIKAKYHRY